ncbi:MAG: acetyl-CoA carboxylase, biotin carboxyl carrier protein [Candidatus Fraserbacteria bacterium RBG_16_55_9]|uniref:Biotin carboxyl carrier protein of acetyl-CoA carboxylase n=1 Tax=Fraserbacteria sp. (strain RBG_16_55_9) TaxID=1817864 RepID=A0A1F5UNU9_FRAXR|nr:MAG: acetyl-CoA carboxylase, biotin carboxyl carrier protein [Candidatus Fraserbacteria bacterium RBG_16_55_9]
MEVEEIKALVELFERSTLTELLLERGETRLLLKRQAPGGPVQASISTSSPPSAAAAPAKPMDANAPLPTKAEPLPLSGYIIKAPLVGTFFRRPSSDEDPYVEVGDRVEVGTTLCLIEAMKVMNEVRAERAGTVKEILVENGKPVDYGQALMVIEPMAT